MNQGLLSIGVDVSKEHLHVFIPQHEGSSSPMCYTTENGHGGFKRIARDARKIGARVCLEPTGGYEKHLVEYLQKHDVPVILTQGRSVRLYAESMGRFSKNDTIDAETISNFADAKNQDPIPAPDEDLVKMRELIRAASKYTAEEAKFKAMLEKEPCAEVRRELRATIRHLNGRVVALQKRAKEILMARDDLKAKFERYQLIQGVGEITALMMIAEMPELGHVSDARAAALAGLAPRQNQSGNWDGKRRIFGGRKTVRNALYMAAFNGVRCNPVLRKYYKEKKNNAPGFKWTIVPVMRKLLYVFNHIARDPNWQPL